MNKTLYNKIVRVLPETEGVQFGLFHEKALEDADIAMRVEQEKASLEKKLMKLRHGDEKRRQISKDIIRFEQILEGDKPKS